jgi:HEPN domain-containing protein
MLKPFRNREIFGALSYLAETRRRIGDIIEQMRAVGPAVASFTFHETELATIPDTFSNFGAAGQEFEIPGILAAAEEAHELFKEITAKPSADQSDLFRFQSALEGLRATFINVMKDTLLLSIGPDGVRYYNGDRLGFGAEVEEKFPSSTPDAKEASRCRALERWTASVMHCMRALEPALLALAEHVLGKPPKKENWHDVLKEIEDKIEAEKKVGRHAKLQFESAAANYFRHIKDAWRNHTMHAKMWFGEEDAIDVYDATRSLMRHLSKRFSEAA